MIKKICLILGLIFSTVFGYSFSLKNIGEKKTSLEAVHDLLRPECNPAQILSFIISDYDPICPCQIKSYTIKPGVNVNVDIVNIYYDTLLVTNGDLISFSRINDSMVYCRVQWHGTGSLNFEIDVWFVDCTSPTPNVPAGKTLLEGI